MKFPIYNSQINLNKTGPRVPTDADNTISKAIGSVADTALNTYNFFTTKMREAREANQYFNAVTDSTSALNNFELELDRDPDWATYGEKFERRQKEIQDAAAKEIKEPIAREKFLKSFQADTERRRVDIQGLARKKEVNSMLADLDYNLTEAVKWSSKDQVIANIEGAKNANIITPYDAEKKQKELFHTIAINQAYNTVANMPIIDGETYLKNPKNTPEITDDDRLELMRRIRYEDQVKKQREQEEFEKRNSSAYNTALKDLHTNQLTYDKLFYSKTYQDLTPQNREHFLSKMEDSASGRGVGKSDPTTEAEIVKKILNPDIAQKETNIFIRDSLEKNLLTPEDALKYTGQNENRKPNYGLIEALDKFDQMEKDGVISAGQKVRLYSQLQEAVEKESLIGENITEKAKSLSNPFKVNSFQDYIRSRLQGVTIEEQTKKNVQENKNIVDQKALEKTQQDDAAKFIDWQWNNFDEFRANQYKNYKGKNPATIKAEIAKTLTPVQFSNDKNDYGFEMGGKFYKKDGNTFIPWQKPKQMTQQTETIEDKFTKWKGKPESVGKIGDNQAYLKGGAWYIYENGAWKIYKGGKWETVQ